MSNNKPDYRTVEDQYYEAVEVVANSTEVPQPDLPQELQFLSPDKQRQVFESWCTLYDASSEELKQREDLIEDFVVYAITPRYVEILSPDRLPEIGCSSTAITLRGGIHTILMSSMI